MTWLGLLQLYYPPWASYLFLEHVRETATQDLCPQIPFALDVSSLCNKMSSSHISFMSQFKCHLFREAISDPSDLNNYIRFFLYFFF